MNEKTLYEFMKCMRQWNSRKFDELYKYKDEIDELKNVAFTTDDNPTCKCQWCWMHFKERPTLCLCNSNTFLIPLS